MIYCAPERGTRELRSTGKWKASAYVVALLEPICRSYRWPIMPANDRDHLAW